MKPHKHADLIKAWADGANIELNLHGDWVDVPNPDWIEVYQYRIKPEPKPDITTERTLFWNKAIGVLLHDGLAREWLKDGKYYEVLGDFKITFDGKTGKIKSAEVIE